MTFGFSCQTDTPVISCLTLRITSYDSFIARLFSSSIILCKLSIHWTIIMKWHSERDHLLNTHHCRTCSTLTQPSPWQKEKEWQYLL